MVDWGIARQVAAFAAGQAPLHGLKGDLDEMVRSAERPLVDYTRIAPSEPVPPPETVDRRAWAEVNLETLRSLLDPVAERLSARLASTGAFAGPLRAAASATVAAEAGLVLGYMSQRVLGQYELSLLQPDVPPRLVFVAANLDKAAQSLGVDGDGFYGWFLLQQLTQVFQFQADPCVRDPLAGIIRPFLASV